MKIVTGFDETFDPLDEKPAHPLLEYTQALDAIEHSLQVTENVFARASKKDLRKILPKARLRKSEDARGMLPLWVASSDVAFDLKEKNTYEDWPAVREDKAELLSSLVRLLAYKILEAVEGKGDLVLVDALRVKISEVGENVYRFSLKQKWTVESG